MLAIIEIAVADIQVTGGSVKSPEVEEVSCSNPFPVDFASKYKSNSADDIEQCAGSLSTPLKPLYYEHLGGYAMHEMKDFNRFSRNRIQDVRDRFSFGGGGGALYSPVDDDPTQTIYITSI